MWLWDILVLGTLGPLDPWTLGLLDCLLTPFYILLFLPTSFYLLLPPGLVWYGGGGGADDNDAFWVLTLEIEIGDGPWTFNWHCGGWVVVVLHLDYSVGSGPLFEFWPLRMRLEMDQDPSLTIKSVQIRVAHKIRNWHTLISKFSNM